MSLVLRGGYDERRPHGTATVRWVNVKRTSVAHAIRRLRRTPRWTLVLIGRRARVWGYWTDGGWFARDQHPAYDEIVAALNRQSPIPSDPLGRGLRYEAAIARSEVPLRGNGDLQHDLPAVVLEHHS